MGRIKKQQGMILTAVLFIILMSCGCVKKDDGIKPDKLQMWLSKAELDDKSTRYELYEKALSEGTLVVYSVSGRAFQAKESFEKEYPGLSVEIKDIRSNDVVSMLKENYETGNLSCDVVICSDCDGSLHKELVEPGIIYSYIPWDIAPNIRDMHEGSELNFLGEAMMPFYNTAVFDKQPVYNIWELTEERFRGKIMMSSPLSSFSTYGFCAQVMNENELLKEAYEEYADEPLYIPEGKTAGMVFWEMLGANTCFVNSNDEVLEGVGNSDNIWIGIMISSKMRYKTLGYHFEPVTRLMPFSSVYTPNCIAIAGGAENINTAKLFIRYVLGETDGKAQGAEAFLTEGTWSSRTDMEDGCTIPLDKIDMIQMDKNYLYENRDMITGFFGRLLEKNISLE